MIQADPSQFLALSGGAKSANTAEAAKGLPQSIHVSDSISQALKDSLSNMDISTFKGVMTGENTILKDAISAGLELLIGFLPKLIGCVLVLWLGFKLIKLLKKSILKLFDKRDADPSIKGFLASLIDVLLKVLLIIMAMDIIGIKATSFIAILGAAGLAVGMALQGTLQNFAGGVIILLLHPFKVGDYIECGGYKGWIREIRIFHTIIQPFNGRTVVVPNSELSNKSLINHTHEPRIRLDVVASVAYGTDLAKAKKVLFEVVENDPLILKDPIPKIAVSELGESSVDLAMWLWVNTDDYWTVWMRIRENIYNALNENGISIPFPQMDVHINHTQIPEPESLQ